MNIGVTIVGAGPAGLMCADVLSAAGIPVCIIDHKRQPARKFLMAGRGGLNLTHSESLEKLLSRYGAAQSFLEPIIKAFPPNDLISWCHGLGVETFVGSSGRVFPKMMKASPLLRALLQRLASRGVTLESQTPWLGFDAAPTIFAMGGASWPELGSDAGWVGQFRDAGIVVNDFQPSNCRVLIPWTEHFSSRFSGQPLKNITLRYGSMQSRGEVVISRDGLEGGAIYQLSPALRETKNLNLFVDLKPVLSADAIAKRLVQPRGKMSESNFLRKALGLTPAAVNLLRETGLKIDAQLIKNVPLKPRGLAGLERAISSAGGVALSEVDAFCQLRNMPSHYCVGEMLDWDAPTGGYLLQACFSTAAIAARHVAENLVKSRP